MMAVGAGGVCSSDGVGVVGSDQWSISSEANHVLDSSIPNHSSSNDDDGNPAFETSPPSTSDEEEVVQRKRRPALQRRRRSLSDCGPLFVTDAIAASCMRVPFVTHDASHEEQYHTTPPQPALPPNSKLAEESQSSRPSTRQWTYQPSKGWNNGDLEYFYYYIDGRRSLTTKAPRLDVPQVSVNGKGTRFSHHQSFMGTRSNTTDTSRFNNYSRCIDHGTSDKYTRSKIIAMMQSDEEMLHRMVRYQAPREKKGQVLRRRLQEGRSIFEMDFPLFENFNLNSPLFMLYGLLVFLITIKMASSSSTPHRLANTQAQ
jgi:hypothetical protein